MVITFLSWYCCKQNIIHFLNIESHYIVGLSNHNYTCFAISKHSGQKFVTFQSVKNFFAFVIFSDRSPIVDLRGQNSCSVLHSGKAMCF